MKFTLLFTFQRNKFYVNLFKVIVPRVDITLIGGDRNNGALQSSASVRFGEISPNFCRTFLSLYFGLFLEFVPRSFKFWYWCIGVISCFNFKILKWLYTLPWNDEMNWCQNKESTVTCTWIRWAVLFLDVCCVTICILVKSDFELIVMFSSIQVNSCFCLKINGVKLLLFLTCWAEVGCMFEVIVLMYYY